MFNTYLNLKGRKMSQILNSDQPVLVLGATGSFAGAVAAELLGRGQSVRVLVRNRARLIARFGQPDNLEIVVGDVQNMNDLSAAAQGCQTIVHGVNYPYDQWFPHMETATRHVLDAARKNKALIVFPGNVYNLGPAGQVPFSDSAPHNPVSRKGRLRQWMEEELAGYAANGGRVLIMRAGDYFGPTARNGYLDPLFGGAAQGKPMMALGNISLAHQWAYVPDLARATADLMELHEELADYEVVNFRGYVPTSQRAFFSDIARVAGSPDKVRRLPWWLLSLVALFSPLIREVMEMKYLYESTVLIDDPRLRELLPDFRPTSTDRAILETVQSYRRESPAEASVKTLTGPDQKYLPKKADQAG
jgi:nucleoside-diphosphate-sugar epimerase